MFSHCDFPDKKPAPPVAGPETGELIKKTVGAWKLPAGKTFVRDEQIHSAVLVSGFYKGRNFRPAWFRNSHLAQADVLVRAINEAYDDGLTPSFYHLGRITSLIREGYGGLSRDAGQAADLDILLTDAFLTLGCHLSAGCVNPVMFEVDWFAKHGSVDVSQVLQQALAQNRVKEALTMLSPAHGSYSGLKKALASYRGLAAAGEWPLVSGGPVLRKDSVSGRVMELKKRLAASGDLPAEEAKTDDRFDERLEEAVIFFQKRHGLQADGAVGPATLGALNVPLKQRIRQIELNLERLRWILGNTEQRLIVVNIADFRLDVIERGRSVLSMKAVVGKPYQSTPIFTAKMTHVIINPAWNVPDSIARKELLKKIRNDPGYLAGQDMEVLQGTGPQQVVIDPATVDWQSLTGKNLPYRFRQKPGPLNALGRLKFMLPNKFDVYLHDTPARGLFSENVRTFSHGCIRIEKPLELAEYVLGENPEWTKEKLLAAIKNNSEKSVPIPDPLNVHFLYLTAWVDKEGVLQFRNDVYKEDQLLDDALRREQYLQ